jgi:hypothetical protein
MASRLGLPRLMLPRLSRGFILCCGTAFSEACYLRRFVRDAKKKPDTRNRVPRTLQQFGKGIKKDRPLQYKGSGTRKAGVIYVLADRLAVLCGSAPPRLAFGAVGFQIIVVQEDAQARH